MTTSFSDAALIAARAACLCLLKQESREEVSRPDGSSWRLSYCQLRHEEAEAGVNSEHGEVRAIAGTMCGCSGQTVDVQPHPSLEPGKLSTDCQAQIAKEVHTLLNQHSHLGGVVIFIKVKPG